MTNTFNEKDYAIAQLQQQVKDLTEELYASNRDVHNGLLQRSHATITQLRNELALEKARSARKDQTISNLGQVEKKLGEMLSANLELQERINELEKPKAPKAPKKPKNEA